VAVASELVRSVTRYKISREILPVMVFCRHRVSLMGLTGVEKVQPVDAGGFHGAGRDPEVLLLAGRVPGGNMLLAGVSEIP
jgi:hypothetical protein